MDPEAYQQSITRPDVLDHTTLNVTLKELAFVKESEIAAEISRILATNRIEKPGADAPSPDREAAYYRVDLQTEHIERITDLFFGLEAQHVREDGDAGPLAAFYAALADKWHAFPRP